MSAQRQMTAQGIENRRIAEIARQRAHRELARRHHEEFVKIQQRERRKLGHVSLPVGRPLSGETNEAPNV